MKFKVSDFVNAVPMTHGDYSKVRGWSPPDVPDEPGYLIERKIDGVEANVEGYTGHVTWMTAVTFKRNYTSEDMDFGRALDALRCGRAVQREGWNGAGMFLYLVGKGDYPAASKIAKDYWGEDALVPYAPYIAMKTAQGFVVPWLASQTDVLAYDWHVIEPTK